MVPSASVELWPLIGNCCCHCCWPIVQICDLYIVDVLSARDPQNNTHSLCSQCRASSWTEREEDQALAKGVCGPESALGSLDRQTLGLLIESSASICYQLTECPWTNGVGIWSGRDPIKDA